VSLWNGILWLHLVAMAFFVGGQLMLAAVVVPVLRGREDGVPLRAAARRFGFGTLAAILVLLATGAAMASHYHKWSNTNLQVKLGLVVVVAFLIHAHMRRPAGRLERSPSKRGRMPSGLRARGRVLDAAIFLVSLAIVWLGIVVAG
jgi:uncharacterized membrane protein